MTFEQINLLNMFLGAGAILLQVAGVLVLILLVLYRNKKNSILALIQKHFVLLGFLVSLSATAFSLVYSEIVNFVPCYLCWWARVLMVPITFLFGAALYYKDSLVTRYVWPLLTAGLILSLYHNIMYYFADTSNLPCDASGVSCYQQLVSVYNGYISIPMLSLTSLFGVLVVLFVARYYKGGSN